MGMVSIERWRHNESYRAARCNPPPTKTIIDPGAIKLMQVTPTDNPFISTGEAARTLFVRNIANVI